MNNPDDLAGISGHSFERVSKKTFGYFPRESNYKNQYITLAPTYFCDPQGVTIIGAEMLNGRVRDGNGCDHLASGTRVMNSFKIR